MATNTANLIAEAEKAYHALVTGTMARVVVDQNGERVEFVAANASRLYQYIQDLKATLPSAAATRVSGPLGFYF
jgi:membrane protease subunit (stomatin/prohibitin family)